MPWNTVTGQWDNGTGSYGTDADAAAHVKQVTDQTGQPYPANISDEERQWLLSQQAALSAKFADQGQRGFAGYQAQGQGVLDALQRQANGQNSVSAEQLRQALQQNQASQMSMAAGASPRNAAMAARTAAIQMGRQGAGMAGQQALAGLQERNQAQSQYGALLQGMSSQQLQAALSGRQNALGGYGSGAYGGAQPSVIAQVAPAVAAAAAAAASDRRLKTDIQPGDVAANRVMEALSRRAGGMTMSDRALKTAIKPGGDKANDAIDGLRPYTYTYKDQALGAGPQVGVMAQDLQKAGLGQAVIRTPIGLAIDPGKLSGANTAMIAALGRRVAELEGNGASASAPDSPAAKRSDVLASNERGDPAGVRSQEALDHRRALLQEIDLRRAGAYPGGDRPIGDLAGTSAQNEMDRRRAMMEALARSAQIAQAGR